MNLIEAMRTEYGKSKFWWGWSLVLGLALYPLAVLSVFYSDGLVAKSFGIIAFLMQLLLFTFRVCMGRHLSLGEQIRRLAMLKDGLGIEPSKYQLAKLQERMGKPKSSQPAYIGPYYDSTLPVGPKRLLEITAESSFFTHALARTSACIFMVISALGISIVFIGLIIVIQAGLSQTMLEAVAKTAVISMAFWATGDFALTALRFSSLARTAEKVFDLCGRLLAQETDSRDEAHIAATEYNCAVTQAPPIPGPIYRWRQDRLNEAWRRHRTLEVTTR
jgi:hypothetical protein